MHNKLRQVCHFFVLLGLSTHLATAFSLRPFNAIKTRGMVKIRLYHAAHNSISMSRRTRKLSIVNIRHHTLYIMGPAGMWRPVKIRIGIASLKRLSTHDSSIIEGKKLSSRGLIITAYDNSRIRLSGKLTITSIKALDQSQVYCRWISSRELKTYSIGSGAIRLAGSVDKLRSRLFGQSHLVARYLRTKYAWIRTHNHASASITPVIALRAFAADHSNIYYYKYPRRLTRDSTEEGNILQLAWDD